MNEEDQSRDLIGVVLKKGSNYAAFSTLLDQHGFKYNVRFKRIFYIDGKVETFPLRDHIDIESCTQSEPLELEPLGAVDLTHNVLGQDVTLHGSIIDNTALEYRSWGMHSIIRRRSPFRKEGLDVSTNLTLPYRANRTGEGVDIYILDAGFMSTHNEFYGRAEWAGGVNEVTGVNVGDTNFLHRGSSLTHGHEVASCAAGNSQGIAKDSQIFFVGIHGTGLLSEDNWMQLWETAYDHYMLRSGTNRPAIANMSYGLLKNNFTPSPTATAGYEAMMDDGLIIVIPAGNSKWNLDTDFAIPAESHPDILVVGGHSCYDTPMHTRSTGTAESCTGYGSGVDIYGPAMRVLCAYPFADNNDYRIVTGTSYAAPYTSGVLACMLEGYQRLTSLDQVRAVIQKLKDNSTKGELRFGDAYFGDGVVHDRKLYMDPEVTFEIIDGLTPL